MTAKYWQKGEVLDYKASAAVKNGEVVSLGTRIGVAGEDIAAGETGHLHVVASLRWKRPPATLPWAPRFITAQRTRRLPPRPPGMCRRVTLPPLRPAQTKPYW